MLCIRGDQKTTLIFLHLNWLKNALSHKTKIMWRPWVQNEAKECEGAITE